MTYRVNYTRSVGMYSAHGDVYKILTENQSAGTSICYVSMPRDITARDVLHVRVAANSSAAVACNLELELSALASSWSADDALQTFDITVNTTDNGDYPVLYAQAAVHADVVSELSSGKGFRLWGRASKSMSGNLLLRGLQMWVEKRP